MASYSEIHPNFRLNGHSYTATDLGEVGYSLVKEGEPHEQEIGDFILNWVSANPQITVSTSGSTGPPGLRSLQKRHMMASAQATARFFDLRAGQSALLCLPARYIAGKMMLVRAMILGLSLDYVAPGSEPLQGLLRHYDFCAMVQAQFLNSVGEMSRIGTLIIGGAPVGEAAIRAAQPLPTKIYETFGMTETISHIAIRRINPLEACFQTLPDVKVAADERGCLVVHAPEICESPVHTNDLVRLLSDTEFVWLGRLDHIVNSGGIKLVPEAIEEKLQSAIPCRYFLAGLPDPVLGEKLVLILEAERPPKKLMEKLRALKGLTPYEVPREVRAIPTFTTTGSGKVNRPETLKALGSV